MRRWKNLAGIATALALCTLLMGGCKGIIDKETEDQFMRKMGAMSITVFPTVLRTKEINHDAAAAAALVNFLTNDGLATVTVSDAEVPITGPWGRNQAKMLRESAEAFTAYVKANPIDTDYALLAEYLFLGNDGGVGGIHCTILDKDGNVAYAVLLNSHHKPFTDASPQTADDCNAVLIQVLREELQPVAANP